MREVLREGVEEVVKRGWSTSIPCEKYLGKGFFAKSKKSLLLDSGDTAMPTWERERVGGGRGQGERGGRGQGEGEGRGREDGESERREGGGGEKGRGEGRARGG